MALLANTLTIDSRKIAEEFAEQLQRRFGPRIRSIILFGSQARGDAAPDSDMDIAVVLDQDDPDTRKAIRDLAAELGLDYGLFVSTGIWSQKQWNYIQTLQTSLIRNIHRVGIALLPFTS